MKRAILRTILILVLSMVVLLCCFVWASRKYGSLEAAIHFFQGQRVVVDQEFRNLGNLKRNQLVVFNVHVKNTLPYEIKIIGRSVSCTCTSLIGLGQSIAPHENANFQVNVKVPDMLGHISGKIKILFDSSIDDQIEANYYGEVQ